jgi:hypothetical protein
VKRLEGARDGDACSDMTRDIDEYVHSTRSICVVHAKICVVHAKICVVHTNICVVYTAISGDLIVCVHCCSHMSVVACSHLFRALSRYTMESVVSMFIVSM